MTARERYKWFLLTGLRAFLSLLDLIGILAVGFVGTSTAIFLTSGSDPDRILRFAGLQIPAVNAQTLPVVSVAILLLFLSKAVASVVLMKKAAEFVAFVEARAARSIAEISFGEELSRARKRSREEVTFAIQSGSPAAFNGILNAVNSFLTEAVLFLVICLGFLLVDTIATIAAVVYFVLIALLIHYIVGSRMGAVGRIATRESIHANSLISDLISVFRELLVLGKRDKYIDDIYKARLAAADSAATQYYLSGMPRYIIEAALLVGVAIFVLSQALTGDIIKSATTIGVFLSGGFRLTAALLPLQSALLTIQSAIPTASTAISVLADQLGSQPKLDKELFKPGFVPNSRNLKSGPLSVTFQNVSFYYPDSARAAVSEVSFDIKAGSQVALMGPSGAGKSTIADLLCRVLIPASGTISVTNFSDSRSTLAAVGTVSYVPQRPGMVSGTLLQNVALAEDPSKINLSLANEAVRLAHLDELISELPEGFSTPIGKLQDGLSGGQMQRLGLARALYTQPGLLVMDEATSALDAESEAEIQNALEEMRGKVTVVLIAHRLNTIQHADQVILVEGGRVKDSGRLKELIARNPSVERVVDLMRVEKS